MTSDELLRIADYIYKVYVIEELKYNNVSRPRLIHNIAFTKYNQSLGFDPLSFGHMPASRFCYRR